MIQLNLLPDVKLQYIKSQRIKHLTVSISLLIIVVSLGLLLVTFSFVKGAQGKHISDLDRDTTKGIGEITNRKGINEILTIQNQLKVVGAKHAEKPAVTRVLPYVAQMLPPGAKITQITVDFDASTMTIAGTTNSIDDTNKLVDTLKFAEYKVEDTSQGKPFSDVVLGSFTNKEGGSQSVFSITLKFNPAIFDNKQKISLVVPGIISTRSDTEKPKVEFTKNTNGQGGSTP